MPDSGAGERAPNQIKEESVRYLLDPFHAPQVSGLHIPNDLYWIFDDPAPLAGMRRPRPGFPWQPLAFSGFRHVVNLMNVSPDYDPSPMRVAHAVELRDLLHGGAPSDPEQQERLVKEA